jgi:hypothetical protein
MEAQQKAVLHVPFCERDSSRSSRRDQWFLPCESEGFCSPRCKGSAPHDFWGEGFSAPRFKVDDLADQSIELPITQAFNVPRRQLYAGPRDDAGMEAQLYEWPRQEGDLNSALQAQLQAMSGRLAEAETRLQQQEEKEHRSNELEVLLQATTARLAAAEAQLQQRDKEADRNAALEAQLQALTARLAEAEGEQQHKQEEEDRSAAMEAQLQAATARLTEAEGQLQRREDVIVALQQRNAELQMRCSAAERECQGLRSGKMAFCW